MRVLVHAGFDTLSRVGRDAVRVATTLEKLGLDVVPFPSGIAPGLPVQFTNLLTKSGKGDYEIALLFGPPQTIQPDQFGPHARVQVGWSEWPSSILRRKDMLGHGWVSQSSRTRWWGAPEGADSIPRREKDWLDLMCVTAPDMIPVFADLDPSVPYGVVPLGYESVMFPELDREEGKQMTFLHSSSPGSEVATCQVLKAWTRVLEIEPLFDGKLICRDVSGKYKDSLPDSVEVLEGDISQPHSVMDLYARSDVMISVGPSGHTDRRALEFMSTGGVVIAGDHMAARNWLHPDTGFPVSGVLIPSPYGDFVPDTEVLAAAIISAWNDRQAVKRKGLLAASRVRQEFDWEKVCKRLIRLSKEVM